MKAPRLTLSLRGALALKREAMLIPTDSMESRALVAVVAIMTLLACLSAGAALLIEHASASWRIGVSRDITIVMKPSPSEDMEATGAKIAALARTSPGVADAHLLSTDETVRILEPWIGGGVDLGKLPLPRLVLVRMQPGHEGDLPALKTAVKTASASASIDDSSAWLKRLDALAGVVVFLALAIFGLVIAAMGVSVAFATRSAVSANRELIEILHLVGASDRYIARQFHRRFIELGLKGAVLGGGAAAALFLAATAISWWGSYSPQAMEIRTLFGAVSLDAVGYVAIAAISLGVGALTGAISRWIVRKYLVALS